MTRTAGSTIGFGAALLLGCALCSTASIASPITCSTTIVLPGGNGFEADTALTAGVCVQTVDALFGNFDISSLPAGGSVEFNLTNFGTPAVGYHGISFNDNYAAGNTYTADYSVKILTGSNLFKELDADFTQNDGTSTLTTSTSEAGAGSIDWTKVGASGTGPDMISYSPGFAELNVVNTLVDGGSVSAISDNAIENAPIAVKVPEPTSMAVLAVACFGFAALRRRKQTVPSV